MTTFFIIAAIIVLYLIGLAFFLARMLGDPKKRWWNFIWYLWEPAFWFLTWFFTTRHRKRRERNSEGDGKI